ncbi:hypothetical protein [Listeria costaricensis]|uniref:hypothetical protein n=1 Tax=Listeria costaricensis TaxID=2026604 RepID=UPI000C069AE7|nr:hypothetical protein [Listeria costaricensis]
MKNLELNYTEVATFSPLLAQVFDLKNKVPQQVFHAKFEKFYLYDMDVFYDFLGWDWILNLCKANDNNFLYFTSQLREGSKDIYGYVKLPTLLSASQIVSQLDSLEMKYGNTNEGYFLTFNEACLFPESFNWGAYFVNEFNFVIIGVSDTLKKEKSFLELQAMTWPDFVKHFNNWSAWTEINNKKFLEVFYQSYIQKNRD